MLLGKIVGLCSTGQKCEVKQDHMADAFSAECRCIAGLNSEQRTFRRPHLVYEIAGSKSDAPQSIRSISARSSAQRY
jgi:hypothetical protein